jgi:hypothetical protein
VPSVALRPRSVPELIDAAVQLLRQHYLELVTTTAVFLIPSIVLRLFVPTVQPCQLPASGQIMPLFLVAVVSFVLGSMSTAAIVVIVSDSYLGRDVSIGTAVSQVLGRIGAVLGATLLAGLAIGLGFVVFVIPGFFCIAWFFAATNVVMVEGKGPMEALSRSRSLAKGSVGRILGTLLLAGIIVVVFQFIVGLILGLVLPSVRTNSGLTVVITSVVSIFVYPFFTVLITLLYYDLRIRKEGFDLELMAKELGAPAPVTSPASP